MGLNDESILVIGVGSGTKDLSLFLNCTKVRATLSLFYFKPLEHISDMQHDIDVSYDWTSRLRDGFIRLRRGSYPFSTLEIRYKGAY